MDDGSPILISGSQKELEREVHNIWQKMIILDLF